MLHPQGQDHPIIVGDEKKPPSAVGHRRGRLRLKDWW
jgi:hypothetical protein